MFLKDTNNFTVTKADTLTTARTINGTSFNGSANITTANWGTARTLTIGNSGKSVNGSGNVSWSWSEMQVPRAYSSSYNFGGNQNAITTAQFITILTNLGAFSQVYWVSRGSWSYASNQYINDTGCGNIHLAGCVVEVIGTTSAYTIRVTTPTTTASGTTNAEFIYVNNGNDYSPGWRRQYNTKNKPTPSEIGAAAASHGRHVPDNCTTITDWNSAVTNGWYMANNAANAPTTGVWYFGEVIAHNTNYVFQTVYQFNASSDAKGIPKYIRAKMNGTWGAWTNVTVAKAVPSNAVFTDTNTWRGIQNNLTSDSTTDSLSAAQGKALKSLVDGKANTSHNHTSLTGVTNIAFAAGSSDSASMGMTVSSDTTYFDFNLTDDTNTDMWRWRFGAWDSSTSSTKTFNAMTLTATSTTAAKLTVSGTVQASTFSGALSGNATTATTLANSRTINGTSFNGSGNITTANWGTARTLTIGKTGKSVNGSANVSWSTSEILGQGTITTGDWNSANTMGVYEVSDFSGSNGPTGAYKWGGLLTLRYGNVQNQVYLSHGSNEMWIRGGWGGTWNGSWARVYTTNYKPTLADIGHSTYTRSSVGTLDWSANTEALLTKAAIAHWNGAYSGTSSNLAYCNRGAFGTIVTKNSGDYATASHTHNNIVSRGNVTAESGVAGRPAVSGLSMSHAYNNGYPTPYGNVISLKGTGDGQILVGWSGTDGAHAPVYVRSKRDNTSTANWSNWAQVYTTAHPQDNGSHYTVDCNAVAYDWETIAAATGTIKAHVVQTRLNNNTYHYKVSFLGMDFFGNIGIFVDTIYPSGYTIIPLSVNATSMQTNVLDCYGHVTIPAIHWLTLNSTTELFTLPSVNGRPYVMPWHLKDDTGGLYLQTTYEFIAKK